ncbi:MAG: DUF4175 family protein [Alphaproteobacteria bacterium]
MSDIDLKGLRNPGGERDPRGRWPFRWRVAAARFARAFESIWPALWPPLAVLGLFLVISLFGLWRSLPGWLHGLGLIGFALAFVIALFRARSAVAWPSRHAGSSAWSESTTSPISRCAPRRQAFHGQDDRSTARSGGAIASA